MNKRSRGKLPKTLAEREAFYSAKFSERWAGFSNSGKPMVWAECSECGEKRKVGAYSVSAMGGYGLCKKCNMGHFKSGTPVRTPWNLHKSLHY